MSIDKTVKCGLAGPLPYCENMLAIFPNSGTHTILEGRVMLANGHESLACFRARRVFNCALRSGADGRNRRHCLRRVGGLIFGATSPRLRAITVDGGNSRNAIEEARNRTFRS
jgi:hypothetical protein